MTRVAVAVQECLCLWYTATRNAGWVCSQQQTADREFRRSIAECMEGARCRPLGESRSQCPTNPKTVDGQSTLCCETLLGYRTCTNSPCLAPSALKRR